MLGTILGPDGLIVVVVLAIVLLFGGKKLPSLARGLGSAAHEFKKGTDEGDSSITELHPPRAAMVSELKRASDVVERSRENAAINREDQIHP
jgi:sec-independent protein translocase protein TatA